MYYARGLRDLLRSHQLSPEFFENLDEFQLQFIEMCFKQANDEKMGLMSQLERFNYELFEDFKRRSFEEKYGLGEDFWKKAA